MNLLWRWLLLLDGGAWCVDSGLVIGPLRSVPFVTKSFHLRKSSLTSTNLFVYGPDHETNSLALPRPTEGELELLRILWERGPSTVRDIHQDQISRTRPLGYTSVLKLLQIMTDKGLVEREESGKAHIYHPAASQNETQDQLVRDISERLFAGSAAQLAMHALALEPVNDHDLEALRTLIDLKRNRL